MPVKRGLGKGLDSLIPNKMEDETKKVAVTAGSKEVSQEDGPVTIVNITKVEPNRDQPRKNFDEDALEELAESIKQYGLLQPILVQDRKTYYEIIAGERRWRASKKAGLKEVPVIIRNYSEQEIVEISLIENIQREDLNPIEEALAYKRLLKRCDDVQQMIIDDLISTGHARALISIEDPEQQYAIAQQIFDEKLSVRDVEKLVKNLNKPAKVKKTNPVDKSLEAVYQDIEENLKQKLSTKVAITSKGNGAGKIEIEFYSHDDLEKIMDLLSR